MTPLTGTALIDTARRIATDAHDGQTDKNGAAYITHPARVAALVTTAEEQAVAWLHDVIEDTDVTAADLAAAGIPGEVIAAVEALTHLPNEPRVDYYARVKAAGALAVTVKAADIDDNLAPARVAQLDPATRERLAAKYAKARTVLGITTGATDG